MKDTNEIEKQLQQKADKYISQKAEEMFKIHEEIAEYLGKSLPTYIDYISDFNKFSNGYSADKPKYFESSSPAAMKNKFKYELSKNYKDKIVAKYTKELLDKIAIF
mgnify:FL=1|tara:strand:+ start:209 stop:526 length:318 start_codon:yes stop_codon:yes gene_type:complete